MIGHMEVIAMINYEDFSKNLTPVRPFSYNQEEYYDVTKVVHIPKGDFCNGCDFYDRRIKQYVNIFGEKLYCNLYGTELYQPSESIYRDCTPKTKKCFQCKTVIDRMLERNLETQ